MTVETVGRAGGQRTGLANALLREIALLLERFVSENQPGAIDLRSLPMTQEDRADLESRLGRGEVAARLTILGGSEVWETRYAGVWWVRHLGADQQIAAEEIAVTRVPEILCAHPADMDLAATRLRAELEESQNVEP